jgi:hypothetical protein
MASDRDVLLLTRLFAGPNRGLQLFMDYRSSAVGKPRHPNPVPLEQDKAITRS